MILLAFPLLLLLRLVAFHPSNNQPDGPRWAGSISPAVFVLVTRWKVYTEVV
jgi:hypothetical protein